FVGALTVNVSNITCPSVPISTIALKLSNTPESLALENLTLNLTPSGKAEVKGTIAHASGIQPKLTLSLSNFPAESLMPKASWSQGLELPVSANATLAANGNTTRKLAQTLDGTLEVTSYNGRMPMSKTLTNILNLEALISGNPIPRATATGQQI